MKTSEQKSIKKQILEACLERQRLLVGDFNSRIENILQHEGLGNEEEYDNTELAQDSMRFAEANALHQALSFATSDLNVLRYLSTFTEVVHTTPERGAVVITDQGNYFVSVGAGQLKIGDEVFTTLSPNCHLYQRMKGSKAGEVFEFNRIRYHIKGIF